jgi:hypothetical protein
MRKTKESMTKDLSGRLALRTSELQSVTGCGRDTAIKIGLESGARIKVGKTVLWNVSKIQKYLDSISEGE